MKILSIRGGGIRGLAPAQMFASIEAATGKGIADYFDLIVGTSTGAILAIALAQGLKASEIVDFYLQDGPAIFHRRMFHRLGLVNSKYDGQVLRAALDKRLGTKLLGSIYPRKKVMICSSCTSQGTSMFFKSYQGYGQACLIGDVAQASAAAPTFFDPVTFGGETYMDGGLFANNPALYALAEAQQLSGLPRSIFAGNTKILDVACPPGPIKSDTGKGALGFIPEAVTVMMEIGMDAVEEACSRFLGKNYMAVVPALGMASPALDDASQSNLISLKNVGNSAAATYQKSIFNFLGA